MADTLSKCVATLGGVPLAATQGIAWRFTTGTAPYTAIFVVHKDDWGKLSGQKGKPLDLVITDSRGVTTTVKFVYVLHEAPSDGPNRVNFVVADKRWLWPYKLVARDYNIPRKTGNRTYVDGSLRDVPIETAVVVDKYDFLAYSLKSDGTRWDAQEAVEDVLDILEPRRPSGGVGPPNPNGTFRIESFPVKAISGRGDAGEFALQGVQLRDPGDQALARLLGYIPGAEIFVEASGAAVVFDGADLGAVDTRFGQLPATSWDGDYAQAIDRSKIRPGKVIVHFQREVECVFNFKDQYTGTTTGNQPDDPFLENVIPTVDPVTTIQEFDPEANRLVNKHVPPGTWVRVDRWLKAMDDDRPLNSFPWTFETIRSHWHLGALESVLGLLEDGTDDGSQEFINVAARVSALRKHFRQTFRINRRYMERIREIRDVRVALLDPVTGARAPAAVWGQACVVPSEKGNRIAARRTSDPTKLRLWKNVDFLALKNQGEQLISTPPSPARVVMVDEELGIFSVEWLVSPYGTVASFIPCMLVDPSGAPSAPSRDLSLQDTDPMGGNFRIDGGGNELYMKDRMQLSVLLTIVPCAPNSEKQFHPIEMTASDVMTVFRTSFRIDRGSGPDMEVFVPPGESTARFAWITDDTANSTIRDLLGLLPGDDPGIEGTNLPGFALINEDRELKPLARAIAAEVLSPFADAIQGVVVTPVPTDGLKLVGNMDSVSVRVGSDGKVDAVHVMPGEQRVLSRFAALPESARRIILGTLPYN